MSKIAEDIDEGCKALIINFWLLVFSIMAVSGGLVLLSCLLWQAWEEGQAEPPILRHEGRPILRSEECPDDLEEGAH